MARRDRKPIAPAPKAKASSSSASSSTRDFDRMFWIALVAFAAATLLAYQPAWHGGFLWDDNGHVTKAVLRPLGGLWRIWFVPGATQQFYPVVHSVFWLQFHLWGLDPTGYHIVNILLHAGSAALLVAILRRLRVPGAVLAGAIFALHPVQVESVAWITELKNSLSGVFYFAAALVYLRFDADRRPAAYWSALGLFVLALFSKSVTGTLPAALLIVFWWQRGVVTWTRDVRPLVPWFAIGMAAGVMTIWMERTFIGAQGDTFDFTLIERTLIAGRAVVFYLTTLVWPANLAFSYPRWQVSQAIWWQYLFPVAVMAVMVGLWMLRRWSRAPLAALLLFGVTLGPALGFVNVYPFAYSFVADHFQYLACAGVIALASAGLVMASNRWAKSTMPALGVVLLIPLALITWRDSHAYVSAEVLYRTTIDRNPDASMAHNNLAGLLLDRQPPAAAEALVHARAAVALAPQRASTHFNLGLALEASGDPTGAAEAYRAAIAHTSAMEAGAMRVAEIYERLAGVLHASGRREEAVAAYQSALALDPLSADTHNDLGVALAELRRFREAEPHFAEAVRLKPDDAQAKDNLVRTRQIIQRGGR